jgi:hypothetical protein
MYYAQATIVTLEFSKIKKKSGQLSDQKMQQNYSSKQSLDLLKIPPHSCFHVFERKEYTSNQFRIAIPAV